jgi:hypothetical protein
LVLARYGQFVHHVRVRFRPMQDRFGLDPKHLLLMFG